MATAMEEMGKALILFDFCRIPWDRKNWISLLSHAFYNHIKKAAYAKTVYRPGNGSLTDALILFKLELIEYWPNRDPESGEPDEYADAIVQRESGLYVDWVDFDGRWFSPESSSLAQYYAQEQAQGGRRVGEERIEAVLSQLTQANEEQLFTADALKVIHAVMSDLDIPGDNHETSIISALEETARLLLEKGIHLSDSTIQSNFMCYPLYPAIVTPEKIKNYWEQ
jgi:AbiV family abortive infection protein